MNETINHRGMDMDALLLSSLLSSRLCHDLISPIGAASNGVEVCHEDPSAVDVAMPLIAQSVASANARLQFYRMAFGVSGGDDGEFGLAELNRITHNYFDGGKIVLSWSSEDEAIDKPLGRMVLLLTQLAGECLIMGGDLTVEATEVGAFIRASGPRVKWKDGVDLVLKGKGQSVVPDAKNASAFLVRALAERENATISIVEGDEESLVVRLSV